MTDSQQTARLQKLIEKGVRIFDPRQSYIDDDVDLNRIHPSATLHPGTRLSGPRTLICQDAAIGREGPVVVINSAVGPGTSIASGFLEDTVILRDARIGANVHLRGGCLLEEQVKTGHCVGLKQTILLSFVTTGSLINFCDLLMAGGTSRRDHSEVGSGFIHFNFTPWGSHGGKATPSLFGDVVDGVFLRSPRIFLGGAGGVVGPRSAGYGSVAAAGQVVRRDVAAGRVVLSPPAEMDREFSAFPPPHKVADIRRRNVAYVAELAALRAWYQTVRKPRASKDEWETLLINEALVNIDFCITERVTNLSAFLIENGLPKAVQFVATSVPAAPLPVEPASKVPHLDWVASLSTEEVGAGRQWLAGIASEVQRRFESGVH